MPRNLFLVCASIAAFLEIKGVDVTTSSEASMANSTDGGSDPRKTAPEPPPEKGATGSGDKEEALLRQRGIGTRLKSLYEDIVSEPLPDDFLSILKDMSPEDGDDKAGAK